MFIFMLGLARVRYYVVRLAMTRSICSNIIMLLLVFLPLWVGQTRQKSPSHVISTTQGDGEIETTTWIEHRQPLQLYLITTTPTPQLTTHDGRI